MFLAETGQADWIHCQITSHPYGTVFDNLIRRGEMPVTISLFVNPGDRGPGNPVYDGTHNRSGDLSRQYALALARNP